MQANYNSIAVSQVNLVIILRINSTYFEKILDTRNIRIIASRPICYEDLLSDFLSKLYFLYSTKKNVQYIVIYSPLFLNSHNL